MYHDFSVKSVPLDPHQQKVVLGASAFHAILVLVLRSLLNMQSHSKLDLHKIKAKDPFVKRKVIRNRDRLKTKPLPMVWDKVRRQKKKEMDKHYSKRVARKQFRGHFRKARRK